MPPSLIVRPSGKVTPACRAEARRRSEREPDQTGQVRKHRLDIVGVTEINADMYRPIKCGSVSKLRGFTPDPTFTGPERFPANPPRATPIQYSHGVHRSPRLYSQRSLLRHRGAGQARALEPEPQGLPMDRRDDLEGDERQREERAS